MEKKTFDFIKNKKFSFTISLIYIVVGLVLFFARGLNLDIDFTAGTLLEVYMNEYESDDAIREVVDKHDSGIHITRTGTDGKNILLRTAKNFSTDELNALKKDIQDDFKVDKDNISSRTIEASMGAEIKNKAIISIIIVSVAILIYISVRFKFDYGLAAVIALLHDVLFMFATYSIFNLSVNSSFVAAILTVLGYSINDTIVIFDRIRENSGKNRNLDCETIANKSISECMKRTIYTSLTTFAAIALIYFLGVEETKTLALSMMVGTVVGTYSSLFIASPLWTIFKKKEAR